MHKAEGEVDKPAGIIDSIFGYESIFSKEVFVNEISSKE